MLQILHLIYTNLKAAYVILAIFFHANKKLTLTTNDDIGHDN